MRTLAAGGHRCAGFMRMPDNENYLKKSRVQVHWQSVDWLSKAAIRENTVNGSKVPQLVSWVAILRCVGLEWTVCPPHGSVMFYTAAEILVLRARAARNSNSQDGLRPDIGL